MNRKHEKTIYASIWTLFMATACYLTVITIPPMFSNSLSIESFTLFAVEIILLAISLLILVVVLKLRKQILETNVSIQSIKLAKVKKAFTATLLTMLLAITVYAANIYLASIVSPPVQVERIAGYFQFSNDTQTWVDAYNCYKVSNMSWYV